MIPSAFSSSAIRLNQYFPCDPKCCGILGRPFSSFLAFFFGSLTGRFEGLPRIKCRRGGVFGGPDIIGFTYQSLNHIPKKKFSNLRRCEEGLAGGPERPGLQRFAPPLPYRWELLSIDAFARCFCFMAGPAQTLQVTVRICATMSFWDNVVYSPGLNSPPIAQTILTQMIIALQYERTYGIPF